MMRSWWELGEYSGSIGSTLSLGLIQCAFCGEQGNWGIVFHGEKRKPNSKTKVINFDVYQCGNCTGYVHVVWSAAEYNFRQGSHDFAVVPWPIAAKPKASQNWPEPVQRYWIQAQESVKSENWDAASVMARSALQIALREQDAKGKTLKEEIDDLAMKGILPPVMRAWSTELRLLGNEAAHPELDQTKANPLDVRDVAQFLDFFLNYLYDLPAKIQQYKDRKAR